MLDSFPRQADRDRGLRPIDIVNPLRGYEYLMPQPPIAGIHDEIADRPGPLVDKETFDVTDIAVARMYLVAHDRIATAQMRIVMSMLFDDCFRVTG